MARNARFFALSSSTRPVTIFFFSTDDGIGACVGNRRGRGDEEVTDALSPHSAVSGFLLEVGGEPAASVVLRALGGLFGADDVLDGGLLRPALREWSCPRLSG